MNQFMALLPFVASIGVFFFATNSQMYKQMNQNHSIDTEIKAIPIEGFIPKK